MEFWIFMLIMDLLLSFTMIGFGKYFMKKAPKEINSVFGYRTSMSMKNKDTWEFAHKYCGKVWYVCGMVMLPITVIFMLLVIGKSEDCVGSMEGIICGVQLIPLIGSILPTEIALKNDKVCRIKKIGICGGEPNERKNLSYSMRNDSLLGKRVKPGYNYACSSTGIDGRP